MKPKLLIVALLIFALSIASMVLLRPIAHINDKYGFTIIMLQSIFFSFHVIEEFYFPGGGMRWFKINKPEYEQAFTEDYFFKVNAIPLILSYLVSLGAFNYQNDYSFMGLRAWFAMMIFFSLNAVFHIKGSIKTKQYSPGLISGVFLYFPLTIYSFIYFLKIGKIDIPSILICTIVALLIQPTLDKIKRARLHKIKEED